MTYAKSRGDNLPVFLAGKSMGSRVAATLAGDEKNQQVIRGVFCFGYPFHPTKKPEKLRLEPLQQTLKPILIVQGDRDTLGDKTEISTYKLSEYCRCTFLADGDHSFKPRVKSGFTYNAHLISAAKEVDTFIQENLLHE
jgi:predicted alpha/beta-hydrolase family hydrolase